MGLLDGILGKGDPQSPLGGLLGGGGGDNGLIQAALALLQQHGGLSGLLGLFRSKGLGLQIESWIGNEPNMPISGADVEHSFGSSAIGDIASQLGISPSQASGALAQVLPEVVNRLTPGGDIPDNESDLLSQGLAMLQGRR